MGWNTGTAVVGGTEGAQTGYNIGKNFGPWGAGIGAAVGLIGGTLGGGFGFGGEAGMPPPSPLAGMSDNMWSWYKQNVVPMQQQSYDKLFGPNAVNQAAGQAQSDVDTQFSRLPQAYKMQMSGLGTVPTAAQTAAFNKQTALQKGVADAGARNAARSTVASTQASVLGI